MDIPGKDGGRMFASSRWPASFSQRQSSSFAFFDLPLGKPRVSALSNTTARSTACERYDFGNDSRFLTPAGRGYITSAGLRICVRRRRAGPLSNQSDGGVAQHQRLRSAVCLRPFVGCPHLSSLMWPRTTGLARGATLLEDVYRARSSKVRTSPPRRSVLPDSIDDHTRRPDVISSRPGWPRPPT